MVTPVAKRQPVAHLSSNFEVSQRRACDVIGADRSSLRYLSLRSGDAVIRARPRELASNPRRFGYRRLLLMLRKCQMRMPCGSDRFWHKADVRDPGDVG
jgi:putative transposase